MRSITTNSDGSVRTAYNGEQTGDRWTQIPDAEYIHPRDAPEGFAQTRYLKSASSVTFDAETASIGAVRDAIIEIDAPDTIPNDGSEVEVVFAGPSSSAVSVDITVAGLSETVTVDGTHTERVTTTATAGETITVSVGGDGVVSAAAKIEVVSS